MAYRESVAELCVKLLDIRSERSLLGEKEERRKKELEIARGLKEYLERYLEMEEKEEKMYGKKRPDFKDIVEAVGDRIGMNFEDARERDPSAKEGESFIAYCGSLTLVLFKFKIEPGVVVFRLIPDDEEPSQFKPYNMEIDTSGFSAREVALLIDGAWSCYRKLEKV